MRNLTVKVGHEGTWVKINLPFPVQLVAGQLVVGGSEFAKKTVVVSQEWFVISREINDREAYESR